MAGDGIQVAVRVRPFNSREKDLGNTTCAIEFEGPQSCTLLGGGAPPEENALQRSKTVPIRSKSVAVGACLHTCIYVCACARARACARRALARCTLRDRLRGVVVHAVRCAPAERHAVRCSAPCAQPCAAVRVTVHSACRAPCAVGVRTCGRTVECARLCLHVGLFCRLLHPIRCLITTSR